MPSNESPSPQTHHDPQQEIGRRFRERAKPLADLTRKQWQRILQIADPTERILMKTAYERLFQPLWEEAVNEQFFIDHPHWRPETKAEWRNRQERLRKLPQVVLQVGDGLAGGTHGSTALPEKIGPSSNRSEGSQNMHSSTGREGDGLPGLYADEPEGFGRGKMPALKSYEQFKTSYLKAAEKVQKGGKTEDYLKRDKRRGKEASAAYEVFKEADDISTIAKAAGFAEADVRTIKNHIFFDDHELYDRRGKFEPDYDMAVAWKRLSQGKPEDRDILLLKHELLESQVEKEYNISASDAHAIATKKYDQAEAVDEMFGEDGEPDGLL